MQRFDGISGQTENFEYDNLDRLVKIKDQNMITKLSMNYLNDGSIENKSDLGDYTYADQNGEPEFPYHAVKSIDSQIEMPYQRITVTSFNSVKTISDCEGISVFEYGPDFQRNLMKVYYNANLEYSKYYMNEYEVIKKPNGDFKKISYIETPSGIVACVINEKIGADQITDDLYYIHSDYLGSVEALSDSDGDPIPAARFSYGAWGALRDPDDWDSELPIVNLSYFEILDRGFTGHEHLKEYDLINMNGRVYDQIIGQFIQPDNNITFPEQAQSYNRFSYALNNPLKYTDPSGEFVIEALGFGLPILMKAIIAYNYDGWEGVGKSLLCSASGVVAGMVFGGISDYLFSEVLGMANYNLATASYQTTELGMVLSGITTTVGTSYLMAYITSSKYDIHALAQDCIMGALTGVLRYGAMQERNEPFERAHNERMKRVNEIKRKINAGEIKLEDLFIF